MELDTGTLIKFSAYLGSGIAIGFGAVGAAIGIGYTAGRANEAISSRPEKSPELFKLMLIGQAITESSAIFALVVSLLLLFMNFPEAGILKAPALLGAGISIGFGAFGSGIGSGFPAAEACIGSARQPEASNAILINMLIGSAVSQTPAIFALVVSFMLMFIDFTAPVSPTWAALIGAGVSTGLAAIGSGIGSGMAAGGSCEGISRQPQSVGQVTTAMLVGQAVSQTPSIFGLLVSFILIFKAFPESSSLSAAMALLSAGISMGFGGIGPGIGNGLTAESAVKWIARNLDITADLMRTMLVGQAVAQSTAIYAMVVSLVLIFVV
ncbi:MAG: ATP synthase F0 subunit C [Desulfobacteraceae bacterium]|nr:MAG: ATP synthase F0 subunit C [Desulfobacteraceae bacterium]